MFRKFSDNISLLGDFERNYLRPEPDLFRSKEFKMWFSCAASIELLETNSKKHWQIF